MLVCLPISELKFGDCQGSSSADALFVLPLMPNPALAGFMFSSSTMPFHHFSTTLIPKEEGVMGGLHMTKDEEMDLQEIQMKLSDGFGNGHLDMLLSFAAVDNCRTRSML